MMHSLEQPRNSASARRAPSARDLVADEIFARLTPEQVRTLAELRVQRTALLEESLAQEALLLQLEWAVPGAGGALLLAEAGIGKDTKGEVLDTGERTTKAWMGVVGMALGALRIPAGTGGSGMLGASAEALAQGSDRTLALSAASTGVRRATEEVGPADDPLPEERIARLTELGAEEDELRYWRHVYPRMPAARQRDLRLLLTELEAALQAC